MSPGNPAAEAERRAEPPSAPPSRSAGRISVCHIASGDRWAGAEAQLASLLAAFGRRNNPAVCAILFNEGRLADAARASGAEVLILPESHLSFFGILSRAADFLRGRGVHILHAHGYKQNVLAALLARQCHIPHLVRTQHGRPESHSGLRRVKYEIWQFADTLATRFADDRVISVSEELRSFLLRRTTSSRIVTIPNGIDTSLICSSLSPADAKRRLGLSPDAPVIGTAGRLAPVKRLDIFINAALQIAAAQPAARFLIVGDGQELPRLRRIVAESNLSDRVIFLGHRDDVYDIIRAFDLFVICSDHEGLPMVLLEAMWLGVPMVVRPVGGVAEVIRDGTNGAWVSSADPGNLARCCLDLLADSARRKQLAALARATITAHYTADAAAAATLELYASLHR